jgi:hypothetical protein
MRPGAKGFTTDVCVPISRLAECIEASQQEVGGSGGAGSGPDVHVYHVALPDLGTQSRMPYWTSGWGRLLFNVLPVWL